MVTLKREEQTEDRYGGYRTRFSSRIDNSDRFMRYADPDFLTDTRSESFQETEYDNYLWEELKRTSPRRITPENEYNSRRDFHERAFEPAPATRPVRRTSSKRATLSFKGKVLIFAYLAVVLLFVSIIVTNAVSLNSYNDEIANMEERLMESETALEVVTSGLATVNGEEIREQAVANGMVEAPAPVSYEVIPLTPTPTYDTGTNWFDRLCDGISSIFGG